MRYDNPELSDRLASEYVLGTLTGAARRRFESLLSAHPRLRAQVQDWELRLNRWADDAPPVSPPPAVWDGLEARLFSDGTTAPARVPWYERLALWRGLSLVSSALAAVLAVVLVLNPTTPDTGYVAMVTNQQQEDVWVVSASSDLEHFITKNLHTIHLPPGRRCYLWLKANDGEHYIPVGALPENRGEILTLEYPAGMSPNTMDMFMVSVEDLSGGKMPTRPGKPEDFHVTLMPLTAI